MREHGLYKFVDKNSGDIIYIGKSNSNLLNRISTHLRCKGADRKFSPYVENGVRVYYAKLPNKVETDIMERALINLHKPALNITDKADGLSSYIHIKEPKWLEYDTDNTDLNTYSDTKRIANQRYMNKLSRVMIWLTPEEKEMVKKQAAEAGLSINVYIRKQVGYPGTAMHPDKA